MSLHSYNFIQQDLNSLFSENNPQELEALKNSTICITGGAGFMGTWLSEVIFYLNENKNFNTKVVVLDRDIEKIKQCSPHLFNSSHFQFQRIDVRYLVELNKDINYIIHAAGLPDSRNHISNPVDVMSSIAIGTETVLKAAERLSNLKMFLNISSSLVYGSFRNRQENIKENAFTALDISSDSNTYYTNAKRYSESLATAYRQQYRMPVATLRPFSVVGPYQPLTGPWAVNNFIRDAIEGHSIKVLGNGETLRSFMYGSDMAFWILKTLILTNAGASYNLGSPEAISIKELANLVQDHFNIKNNINFYGGSDATSNESRMVPDTSLIQNTFKLKLTVPLKEAIKRSVQWYLLEKNNNLEVK